MKPIRRFIRWALKRLGLIKPNPLPSFVQRARDIQKRMKEDPQFAREVMEEGIARGIITPPRDPDAVKSDPHIHEEEW